MPRALNLGVNRLSEAAERADKSVTAKDAKDAKDSNCDVVSGSPVHNADDQVLCAPGVLRGQLLRLQAGRRDNVTIAGNDAHPPANCALERRK